MVGKREALRQQLTARLLAAATHRISSSGLSRLRAREITADADCGLGTIYKCFVDLDDLVFHVNAATLEQLDRVLVEAGRPGDGPNQRLIALAIAYLDFAVQHRNLWSALFEHRDRTETPFPDWHLAQHDALFRHVIIPLKEIQPGLTDTEAQRRARSIFSAAHGIVALSLEDRSVGVEREALAAELEIILQALVRGLSAIPAMDVVKETVR